VPDPDPFYELRNLVWTDKAAARKRFAADANLRHLRNSLGETLLHWFAVENCQEEVGWLLERGVPLNTVNDFGSSPLLEATQLGYTELVLFLLEKGADPRPVNNLDETALSIAQERGNATLIAGLEAALIAWEDYPMSQSPAAPNPTPINEQRRLDDWLKQKSGQQAKRYNG
jgi:ankyrin repeat protein